MFSRSSCCRGCSAGCGLHPHLPLGPGLCSAIRWLGTQIHQLEVGVLSACTVVCLRVVEGCPPEGVVVRLPQGSWGSE